MSNLVWNGKMRLSNVQAYVAEALNVPVAAISIEFRYPHPKTRRIKTIRQPEDLARPVSDLRILWQ